MWRSFFKSNQIGIGVLCSNNTLLGDEVKHCFSKLGCVLNLVINFWRLDFDPILTCFPIITNFSCLRSEKELVHKGTYCMICYNISWGLKADENLVF